MTRSLRQIRASGTRARITIRAVRTVPVVIMAALALVLSACGGDAGGGDVRTVVVWDRAGSQADTKKKYFEEWNKTEGAELGIKVNYEPQAADKYEEVVRVAFQTDRAPDIFHTPSSQMGGFVGAGWVQPLDGVVDEEVLNAAEPYLGDTSELVWDGKPYAIPTTLAVNRLVINTELFTKSGLDPKDPPATFSELVQASKKVAEYKKGQTYGMALRTAWVGFRQWDVDLMVMASNPELATGMFNRSTGKYEMNHYAEVVSTLRQLIADKSAYPGSATMDSDVAVSAFANGETAMMINSGFVVSGLRSLDSDIDISAAPLPVADGEELVRMPMNAGYPYGISSTAEDTEATATVLEALVSDEVQQVIGEANVPPVSPEVWESPELKQKKDLQMFRPTEVDEQWPKNPNSVVPVEGKNVDQTIVELVLEPDLAVDSTLQDLEDRYNAAYDEAVQNDIIDPKDFTG